jgi:Zn-dependent protease
MPLEYFEIALKIAVFLLAISVHESAHALGASWMGDQTARLLGRITLNPVKHIDPFGSVLVPALSLLSGFGIFGWAKPTPVDTRQMRQPLLGEIVATVAGPVSNFLLVGIGLLGLFVTANTSALGRATVQGLITGYLPDPSSLLLPLVWFLYLMVAINTLLALFNLLPIPPLDGSHVFKHLLPDQVARSYEMIGGFGFIILILWGGRIMGPIMMWAMSFWNGVIVRM